MRSVSGASKKPSVLAKAPRPLARRPALRASLPSRMVRGQEEEDDNEHQHHHDDGAGDGDDHGQSMDIEENASSSDAPNEANEASSAAAAVEAAPVVVKQSLTKTTKVFKRTTPALDTFKPDLDGMEFSQLGSQTLGATGDHLDSSSFSLGESVSSSTAAALQPINPSLWLQHADAEGDEPEEDFLHMYWLDATEVRGVVYLFGKVAITEEEEGRGGEKTKSTRYVSACVAISGCERNLFVLPRATGETAANGSPVRASLAEVHQEISRILVPTIIPKSEGAGFRCKKVKRSYAFEHGDVPREETEYLKVVYSSRYASPSPAQCGGGQCIERIFGGSSSAVELFLLKRKLMGPCWIKVRSPKTIPEASWCKIEVGVESPKLISRVLEAMPPPTLLAMCISLKTAVNPATHVHELIAISCLTHNKVDVEADTDTAPRRFTSFTLVRPLGSSCGASYTPAFPHDLTPELSRLKTPINVLPNERALLNTFFQRLGLEDPDILSSHNLFGFEFDVIINRALHHKLGGTSWSKLGRLRRTVPPKGISDRDFTAGRVLCDTYKAAKEFLRETTYSLSHLSYSQLGGQHSLFRCTDSISK